MYYKLKNCILKKKITIYNAGGFQQFACFLMKRADIFKQTMYQVTLQDVRRGKKGVKGTLLICFIDYTVYSAVFGLRLIARPSAVQEA